MLVFEFQFNPPHQNKFGAGQAKQKKDIIFDSFCYEPENDDEKKLGNLYIIAESKDDSINNPQLLNDLASLIKQEYYAGALELPKKKLKKALEKANKFLIDKAGEKGDIDLLKKLNLLVLSLSSPQFENGQEWQIDLAKKGNIKVLFSRGKEIVDIGQNLEIQKGGSLSKFEKITSGKLLKDDKVMVFTEQVFDYFENNNLMNYSALKGGVSLRASSFGGGNIPATEIEKIASLSNKKTIKKEIKKIFKEQKEALSKISGIFLLIILKPSAAKIFKRNAFQKLFNLNLLTKLRKPSFNKINSILIFFKSIIAFLIVIPEKIKKIPQKISETWKQFKTKFKTVIFSKKLIIIFLLILILAIGYLIFKNEREKEIQTANQSLQEIRIKVEQAGNFLIFKEEEKANLLLQNALKDTLPLIDKSFILKDKSQALKKSIEEQLYILNKIEEIKEPLLSNDFNENDFGSEEIIYRSKVYSLNPAAGEIIKEGKIWGKSEKLINAKSIAVDGNVWVLDNENKILRFYTGKYKDTLEIIIFPEMEEPKKIWASYALPYIYILEPCQKRIIIVNKSGELIKQYFSEKFDNLKDFIVSENGKTIWLLNNSKVYKIEF